MKRSSPPVLLLCIVVCAGCGNRRSGVKLSTPKEAATSLFQAMYDGDLKTARACVLEGDAQEQLVQGMTEMMTGMRQATDAIFKRFKEQMKTADGKPINPQQVDPTQIANGVVTINGSTATIRVANGRQVIPLHKQGDEWRVDMAGFCKLDQGTAMGIPEKTRVQIMRSMLSAMGKAGTELAGEIEAGRYSSAKEAMTSLSTKMHAAIQEEAKRQMKAFN